MRIAVSTQDGTTICGHLGKCRNFLIYETDGKSVVGKERISVGGACPGHEGPHAHGECGNKGHNVNPFEGCHAVITQGMGQGMMSALSGAGIRPVITGLTDPDEAVRLYLKGEIGEAARASCGCSHH